MFNRTPKAARFLGRDNAPPDTDEIRADSPRHHGIRNPDGSPERTDDALLKRMADKQLVRDEHGHVFAIAGHAAPKSTHRVVGTAPDKPPTFGFWRIPARMDNGILVPSKVVRIALSVPAKTLEAKGWRYLGPDAGASAREDIDERHDIGDGETMSLREQLRGELDHRAYELRVGDYKTGRVILDGADRIEATANDRDMSKRVTERGKPLAFTDATKPKRSPDADLWHDATKDKAK